MKKILLSFLLLFAALTALLAVEAYPGPITVTQPDGTTIVIRIHGDEYLNWTTCGNSLVTKASDGYWHYAAFGSDGVSNASGVRVTSTPAGDGSSVTPPVSAVAKALEKRSSTVAATSDASTSITLGERHFLILLIEFSDKSFSMSKSDFEDMLNGESYAYNGAVGSVKKYFGDVSSGKFSPVFDVFGPIKVSYTSAECAADDEDAVVQACKMAHNSYGVDFSDYCIADSDRVDNVFYFFPGYNQAEGGGSDCIWPAFASFSKPIVTLDGVGICKYGCTSEFRGSSGATMAGIGTFCHEFGHVLGLPDLYDTDYSTNGKGNALSTLSLMSRGNYNDSGRIPPYLTYEEKHILGWDDGLTLFLEGTNSLEKTSANRTYYTPTTTENEYFLFENRPCQGWDAATGAPGLAVYHVDKSDCIIGGSLTAAQRWQYQNKINAYADHQCFDLVESVYPESALTDTSQITFPGSGNVTSFTSATSPAATSWAGVPTDCNLTEISFDAASGVATVNVVRGAVIKGTTVDSSGEPLSGVLLSFSSSSTDRSVDVVSDGDGLFEARVSSSDTYTVTASKEGFAPYSGSVTVNVEASGIGIVMSTPEEASSSILQMYEEVSGSRYGFGSGTDCYAGVKFRSSQLKSHVGATVNSVSFMADNGGTGTADKMGVRVYFDSAMQCDVECPSNIFGTMCTVDLSNLELKIPANRAVTFVYYVLNPSCDSTIVLADSGSPVTNANLTGTSGSLDWHKCDKGNVVIRASITDKEQIMDLAGFNYIPTASSYKAGDQFSLTLVQSSVNAPSAVAWTVNGETVTDESITLSAGVYTVCATVTYGSGRIETVETRIQVSQ